MSTSYPSSENKFKLRKHQAPQSSTTDNRLHNPCLTTSIMVQRADSHDDVYDRQIRLWGADAQVSLSLLLRGARHVGRQLQHLTAPSNVLMLFLSHLSSQHHSLSSETHVQRPSFLHQPLRRQLRNHEESSIGRCRCRRMR